MYHFVIADNRKCVGCYACVAACTEAHRGVGLQGYPRLHVTRTPQGIVAVAPLLTPPPPKPDEKAVYLHQIQDPGNLGTILRTLAWFGNFRCLLSPDSVEPFNGKAVRASMGAILHVPVETDVTLEELPARYETVRDEMLRQIERRFGR